MPHQVLECEPYTKLSGKSVKLLMDLFAQYRGNNNGDLGMAWKVMEAKGWRSRDALDRARKELLENGFIMLTRQGGKHQCNPKPTLVITRRLSTFVTSIFQRPSRTSSKAHNSAWVLMPSAK